MWGRMTQNVNAKALVEKYALGPERRAVHLEPRFNGAPGQEFATVGNEDGTRCLAKARFSFAPPWVVALYGDEHVDTFAILTTDAAPAIAHLHHRQPVVLDETGVYVWLDPEADHEHLLATVQEAADGTYEARPVSREVNDPRIEGAWLVERIAA